MRARALIFHMSIPCDKTFLRVPFFFTLWPWPWSLTHFVKTLTLLITFEQWVLELWCFTWVFLVIRPFCEYHYFLPCDLDLRAFLRFHYFCDLDLRVWHLLFKNFNVAKNVWIVSTRALIFTWISLVMRSFSRYLNFWHLHLTNF